MNKLILALLATMMMVVAGCATTTKSAAIPATTPFTEAELGDASALEEVAEVADEAVEDLPEMVSAES